MPRLKYLFVANSRVKFLNTSGLKADCFCRGSGGISNEELRLDSAYQRRPTAIVSEYGTGLPLQIVIDRSFHDGQLASAECNYATGKLLL
jgi:hypothetical protein